MKPDFDLSYWDGDVQWTPLFGEDGLLVAKVITATKNGTSSTDVETSPEEDAAAGKDRIARLVACWNACQGIPTEALNAGGIQSALSASADLLSRVDLALTRGYVGAGLIEHVRNQLKHVGH